MKKIILFMLFILQISTYSNAQNLKNTPIEYEIAAINDVLNDLLKNRYPTNPIGKEKPYSCYQYSNYNTILKNLKPELKVLCINDTLIDFFKIMRRNRWLIKRQFMRVLYKKIKHSNKKLILKDKVFNITKLRNHWFYKTTTIKNIDSEWIEIRFSRVCFDKKKLFGMFYCKVTTSWDEGYESLVYIRRSNFCNIWHLMYQTTHQ